MSDSKDEFERSAKRLKDAFEQVNYENRMAEKQRREKEAAELADKIRREADQRRQAANAPHDEKQKARARAEVKESIRLNKDLRESGVKGFDRFDTSLNQVFLSSQQDTKALRAHFRAHYWPILREGGHAAYEAALRGAAAGGDAMAQKLMEVTGLDRQAGDRALPEGRVDLREMLEFDAEGRMRLKQSLADIPEFAEHVPKDQHGRPSGAYLNEMDKILQQAVAEAMKSTGCYRQVRLDESDPNSDLVWEHFDPEAPEALGTRVHDIDMIKDVFGDDLTTEFDELIERALEQRERDEPLPRYKEDDDELEDDDEFDHDRSHSL